MTTVRIYQPPKSAMQSGKANMTEWWVKFETRDPLLPEPLSGWVSAIDMRQELHLTFPTLGEALDYANANGFKYTVMNPTLSELTPKAYATNFTNPRVRGE